MFLEILIAITLGVLAGTFTGLIPGVHVNLVALLLALSSPLIPLPVFYICVIIICCAITHTFISSIPSIYLGAPDSDNALSVLPGHRYLFKGLGHVAVLYTIVGSLFSLVACVALFPLFLIAIKAVYAIVSSFIGHLLAFTMAFMIIREKKLKKIIAAAAFFLISGSLGIITFNIAAFSNPLFHMLSGLFGISLLVVSLIQTSSLPKQSESDEFDLPLGVTARSVAGATGMGFIAAFLPGFGSSQAAILAKEMLGDIGDKGFLILVGGINTANMLLSLCTVYVLDKARNGAIVSVRELIGRVDHDTVLMFILSALVAASFATIVAIKVSLAFCRLIQKVHYPTLIIIIMTFIVILSFLFDGFLGLYLLLISTFIGMCASISGIGKNHLMGCLILPVIFYFLL